MHKNTECGWLLLLALFGGASQLNGQSPALELTLEAVKQEFRPGEPLAVKVTLTNVSKAGVYLFRTLEPEGLLVSFTVLNERGEAVYSSPLGAMERSAGFLQDTFLLNPEYHWGVTFKLSNGERRRLPARYLPGKYRISAEYENHDPEGKGGTLTGTFPSNTVEVRVVGAAKD